MENTQITVEEFVKKYKETQDNEALWEAIRLKKYVPYSLKAKTAIEIMKDNFVMNNHMILKNTPLLYVLNRMCVIELYCPGICVSTKDALADYDLLCESGALEDIIQAIGKDAAEFDTVFHMTFQDFMENNSSPQAYVSRFFTAAMRLLDGKADALLKILKETNIQELLAAIPSPDKDVKKQPDEKLQ